MPTNKFLSFRIKATNLHTVCILNCLICACSAPLGYHSTKQLPSTLFACFLACLLTTYHMETKLSNNKNITSFNHFSSGGEGCIQNKVVENIYTTVILKHTLLM